MQIESFIRPLLGPQLLRREPAPLPAAPRRGDEDAVGASLHASEFNPALKATGTPARLLRAARELRSERGAIDFRSPRLGGTSERIVWIVQSAHMCATGLPSNPRPSFGCLKVAADDVEERLDRDFHAGLERVTGRAR